MKIPIVLLIRITGVVPTLSIVCSNSLLVYYLGGSYATYFSIILVPKLAINIIKHNEFLRLNSTKVPLWCKFLAKSRVCS